MKPLNLFYREPDPDRWFKFDRYLRKIIRRIYRGKPIASGQYRVFLDLIEGLDRLKIPYRVNDLKYINKHPDEVACIIGKDNLLYENKWKNPIAFGPSFGIHPLTEPNILNDFPIKKIIVPGPLVKTNVCPLR